ncbi:MAG: FecR domain-containing protein [Pseudomonadota bacterium]
MSTDDGSDLARRKLAEVAASILRRLDENPKDARALADKEAFLSRSKLSRHVYEVMERGFAGAPKSLKDRDRRYSFALLGALLASLALLSSWNDLRLALLADHLTGQSTKVVTLNSGDITTLDASSAIADETSGDTRTVVLLDGSGFFDVDSDGRRFVVEAGSVTAEALGTEFEVMRFDDDVIVTVQEGVVEVTGAGQVIRLHAGEQLRVTPLTTSSRTLELDAIASWRRDQLTLDGMTFGEAVSVVARRLPGQVVIVNRHVVEDEVAGVLDLADPLNALDLLSATSGAGVTQVARYLNVIRNR